MDKPWIIVEQKVEKRRGRPRVKDKREYSCTIHLNKEEKDMLEYVLDEYDVNASEFFRKYLYEQYDEC